MLSRDNIEINATDRTFDFLIPIYQKLADECPINKEINVNACDKAIEKCINYDYMKSAINYELNYREEILKKVIKIYDKNAKGMDLLYKLFDELGVDARVSIGRAHTIDSYLTQFSNIVKNSGVEAAKQEIFQDLSYKRRVYFDKQIFHRHEKENYLDLMIKRFLDKVKLHEKTGWETIFFSPFPTQSINDEALRDKLNLYWISPDLHDTRNVLAITGHQYLKLRLNEVDLAEFCPEIAYNNYNRVFEDLFSALIGRELAINYLNELI